MTQDTAAVSAAATLASLTGASDPASKAAQRAAAADEAWADTWATIKEKGFSAFVEDLEKEKLEKLRAELLRTLGVTEEDLEEMDPAARGALEARISQQIQKRLAAASLMNAEGKDGQDAVIQEALQVLQGVGGAFTGASIPLGDRAALGDPTQGLPGTQSRLGRDMLLTLQQADDDTKAGLTDVRDSRARGRGLPTG
ncbi:hypothetical protein F1188_06220 [Roseospira marina]|uniref:Uncharacterized protein n=1 Tax=Roseospira marina TaxID=140057 RepID=A0A5M6IDU7_9PROT|nr:hypothetical protein [Roseospira marina]KAA5606460.1 hypothetical protein F1188_06220 [Roseospira marina]MBB4314124.1 hypothetical protein [Roseospira marina]MBB5087285.1 hypothetical protein [Roseospira marina]